MIYRIRFKPVRDILLSGIDPLLLLRELRGLGDCRIFACTDDIPPLNDLNPEFCYTSWDILLSTRQGERVIRDVFIFVEGRCDLEIEVIDICDESADEERCKQLGEILIERGDISTDDLKKVLESQKRIGDLLVESQVVDRSKVASALAEQEQAKKEAAHIRTQRISASIRVSSEKLDTLVDLVGELVTVQARLSQTALSQADSDVIAISEAVERITDNLRDNTLSLRMVPIGTTFSRFRRLTRELSKELGKTVELTTEGAETELDKNVIERLNEPLVHIIRNSIDHGIESPEERMAAGKPERGTVHIAALHSGVSILIRISDDGRGLDAGDIREKAVMKGLITEDMELAREEIYALILTSGFSTSSDITSISGRGLGMEIVKKSLDALRGSVEILSTEGSGTSITLKLPLTLAIIEGLLVEVAGESFVLPLSMVEECIELVHDDHTEHHGRQIVNVRGKVIPYLRLRDSFRIPGELPGIEQIVLTETSEGRVGIVVDEVIGGYQTVIKTLGRAYKNVDVISGATILGDGTVALILDIQKLIASIEKKDKEVRSF